MGGPADGVLLVAYTLSFCFTGLLLKSMWTVFKNQRQAQATNSHPISKREIIKRIAIPLGLYAALGLAYYLGWLSGGVRGGVIAAISGVVGAALVLLALAVKAAWVSARSWSLRRSKGRFRTAPG